MSYVVIFRGRRACPCLAEWLPVFEAELLRRGVIRNSIDIAQLIGGYVKSGGTHATGGAADIWQRDKVTLQVAEEMGAAAWGRTAAQGFSPHTHLVLNGCPHNGPARYQVVARQAGYNGLGAGGRGGRDPRGTKKLRTWKAGITWAKAQQKPKFNKKAATYVVDQAPAYGRASYGLDATKKTPARPRGWTFKSKGWSTWKGVLYIQGTDGYWYHGPSFDLVKKAPAPKPPKPVKRATTTVATYNPSDKMGNDAPRAGKVADYLLDAGADLEVVHMQELTGITAKKSASAWSRLIRNELDALGQVWRSVIPTTAWNENYLFYRGDRKRLVKRLDDLIIRVPGAEGKHATIAILEDLDTGHKVLHVDPHLDPRNAAAGDRARQAQGRVIRDHVRALAKVEKFDDVIIAGDMNQPERITAFADLGLVLSSTRAKKKINADVASFQGTSKTPKKGPPIDHVYVDEDASVDEYEVMVLLESGRFPQPKHGDHQPVRTALTHAA